MQNEKQLCSEREKVLGTEQYLPLDVNTESQPLICSFKDSTGPHTAKPDIMKKVLKHIIFLPDYNIRTPPLFCPWGI